MTLARWTPAPIVTVKMPNGERIKGVTLGDMFRENAAGRNAEQKEKMVRQFSLAPTKTP
jgi:hypothetical protein